MKSPIRPIENKIISALTYKVISGARNVAQKKKRKLLHEIVRGWMTLNIGWRITTNTNNPLFFVLPVKTPRRYKEKAKKNDHLNMMLQKDMKKRDIRKQDRNKALVPKEIFAPMQSKKNICR